VRDNNRWLELGAEINELTRQRGSFNAKIAALRRRVTAAAPAAAPAAAASTLVGGPTQVRPPVSSLDMHPMVAPGGYAIAPPNLSWGEEEILLRSPGAGSESSITSADLIPSSDHGWGDESSGIDPDLFHPEMPQPQVLPRPRYPTMGRELFAVDDSVGDPFDWSGN